MSDVLTPEQRRFNMSRVRAKDTKPEMMLRRGLHSLGFRYQLHRRDLAGCPDLTFPRYRAVVFVHGCFWHGHNCHLFKVPETHTEFWLHKISHNAERDKNAAAVLLRAGWRALTVWECALRGRGKRNLDSVLKRAASFLTGKRKLLEVKGKQVRMTSLTGSTDEHI